MAKPTKSTNTRQKESKALTTTDDTGSPGRSAPPVPRVIYREAVDADHHLFVGSVESCLKADKWSPVPVYKVPHIHHFHTINSNGAKQTHTSPIANHVHAVEWGVDDQGNLVAKCGPPLKKVQRFRNGVSRTVFERIKVKNYSAKDDEPEFIDDNHTHTMTYAGSNKISQGMVQKIRQENMAVIGTPGGVVVHDEVVQAPEGFSAIDADPGTRR